MTARAITKHTTYLKVLVLSTCYSMISLGTKLGFEIAEHADDRGFILPTRPFLSPGTVVPFRYER